MNTPQEQQRSCFNCRNESQGRCEWARDTESRHRDCRFCPPWISEGMAIGSDMGYTCQVWELREAVWEPSRANTAYMGTGGTRWPMNFSC